VGVLLARTAPPGSTVGIVSPGSAPESRADVMRGSAWWEAQGYRVVLAAGALERTDWHAGSPQARARDIQEAFADPGIDAIQCLRGGYGSAQVVPLLDFEAIAASPKAFVGFSDITALHAALLRFTGLATFYGPTLTSLGPGVAALTAERLLGVLGGATTGPVPHDERLTPLTITGGRATGIACICATAWASNIRCGPTWVAATRSSTPCRRVRPKRCRSCSRADWATFASSS
jgi:muramoyltetrapeptide carboxypeptidase